MTDPQPTLAPAGWYTDPSGQPGERWWDGASWSAMTRPTPQPVEQPPAVPAFPSFPPAAKEPAYPSIPLAPLEVRQPVPQFTQQGYQPGQQQQTATYQPMQSFGAVQPYGTSQPYGYSQPYSAQGVNPSTEYMWRIAFWPLTGILTTAVYALMGGLSYSSGYISSSDLMSALSAVLLYLALSVLCYALFIRFALQDSRELRRRQIREPFGWGWAFIPIVYVIGRTAVVYSRTGQGLAPLFVCVASWLFANVIGIPVVVFLTLASSGMYS